MNGEGIVELVQSDGFSLEKAQPITLEDDNHEQFDENFLPGGGDDEQLLENIPVEEKNGTEESLTRKRKNSESTPTERRKRRKAERRALIKTSIDYLKTCYKPKIVHRVITSVQSLAVDGLGITSDTLQPRQTAPTPSIVALQEKGYRIVPSGTHAVVIVDANNRPIAVRAQRPTRIQSTVVDSLEPIFERMDALVATPGPPVSDNRGDFPRLQIGIYHNAGTKAPVVVGCRNKSLRGLIEEMVASTGIQGLLRHISTTLVTFFPEVADSLANKHDELKEHISIMDEPHLSLSPFTTITVNLGPRTVITPHRDSWHLASGVCALFVAGSHSAENGALLVLDELKVAFENQAGDLFLFPSALVTHHNTDLIGDSPRRSVVFWTSEQAVRYYEKSQVPTEDVCKEEKTTEQEDASDPRTGPWDNWLTLDEILQRAEQESQRRQENQPV